jgi:hypothetical protein
MAPFLVSGIAIAWISGIPQQSNRSDRVGLNFALHGLNFASQLQLVVTLSICIINEECIEFEPYHWFVVSIVVSEEEDLTAITITPLHFVVFAVD